MPRTGFNRNNVGRLDPTLLNPVTRIPYPLGNKWLKLRSQLLYTAGTPLPASGASKLSPSQYSCCAYVLQGNTVVAVQPHVEPATAGMLRYGSRPYMPNGVPAVCASAKTAERP